MKLSQSVAYAVHATLRLAENREGSPISCNRLAEQGHMPERFLLQILRDLAKKGILQSTRGGGGGFMLDRRPEEISLLEVIEAVEGSVSASLPLGTSFPHPAGERLHGLLRSIAEDVRRKLQSVKLSDLVA
jgi:Rrf2 family transcriptional regulator, cysteine metabolism repressor